MNKLFIIIAVLLYGCSQAWATDMRMNVDIAKQTQPNIQQAAQKSLPILLQRLLAQHTSITSQNIADPASLVSSLFNHQDHTQVIFHDTSVSKAMQALDVAWFEKIPLLHLRIEMFNTQGKPMLKSQRYMEKVAKKIARDWGIGLVSKGTNVFLRWQWQQDGRVSLVVQSSLATAKEQRHINLQNSAPQMQAWLQQVMLKERDAQLRPQLSDVSEVQGEMIIEGHNLLKIDRPMRLEEEVALETALRAVKAVTTLIPYRFNQQSQAYQLSISTTDDGWLQRWFQQRGMQLSRSEQGWVVR